MLQICLKFKFVYDCHSGPKTTKYWRPTLVRSITWTLSQHWGVTLLQHSHNIAIMLWQYWSPCIGKRTDHNIHTTLPKHCGIVSVRCWGAALPQRCLNIVPVSGSDVARFTQLCLNIVATSVPNIEEQRCVNIQIMLPERCCNVGPQHWDVTSPQRSHISMIVIQLCSLVRIQHWTRMLEHDWYSVDTMLAQKCCNVSTMFTQYYGNVRTMLSGCPDNIAAML